MTEKAASPMDAASVDAPQEARLPVGCRSTMFGEGCGHPVVDHDGNQARPCCCCNWQHNLPDHRAKCLRCQAIDKAAGRD